MQRGNRRGPASRQRHGVPLVLGLLLMSCGLAVIVLRARSGTLTREQTLGEQAYYDNCAACHDYSPAGLKKTPPSLSGLYSRKLLPDGVTPVSDLAVQDVIVEGKRTMPAFDGRLTSEEIHELIAYLHRK